MRALSFIQFISESSYSDDSSSLEGITIIGTPDSDFDINEISEFIKGRTQWRTIGLTFETISKIFMGAGSILSFAAGVYVNTNYSFIAGSVSTLSVVSLQFATFCYKESKQSTDDLNTLLRKLKLDTIPELNVSLEDNPIIKDHAISLRETLSKKEEELSSIIITDKII